MKYILLVFNVLTTCLWAQPGNHYVLDGWHEDNSVIKIWYTVLGLLDEYDTQKNAGFSLVLGEDGQYYDKSRGDNWWKYYFSFDAIGNREGAQVVRIPRYQRSIIRFRTACTLPPERGHELLEKYMLLHPELLGRLQQLKNQFFQSKPILGVYYQSPAIPEVQKNWDFEELCQLIVKEKEKIGATHVYVFTELQEMEAEFKKYFGDACCLKMGTVSKGELELLTMYLLAECDALIASGSYQSIGAKFINPKLKVLEINPFPYSCK